MNIIKPTFVINKKRSVKNIERMRDKALNSGVIFRPHFKTHQTAEIGEWYKSMGVNRITVSSVEMAKYFAEHRWQDITIAFPVNILEIDDLNQLSTKIHLNILVESPEVVNFLSSQIRSKISVWLKIDTGYGRTGIEWSDEDRIVQLCNLIKNSPKMNLQGLLTHSGHSYQVKGAEAIKEVYRDTIIKMSKVKVQLTSRGFNNIKISVGDTPTCSIVENFGEVGEIRPGNFIFYDIMQLNIGSCREEDIAAAVVCPVVSRHAFRSELVIYGGAVHLSKDSITDPNGHKVFGYVCRFRENRWGSIEKDTFVSAVFQEHGIIKASSDLFDTIEIGDLIAILPVHSCLAMNLMKNQVLII